MLSACPKCGERHESAWCSQDIAVSSLRSRAKQSPWHDVCPGECASGCDERKTNFDVEAQKIRNMLVNRVPKFDAERYDREVAEIRSNPRPEVKKSEAVIQRLRKSFEEMAETMDPAIRSSLEGHPDKAARDSLTRAIYHDTLVPGVGNKRAYRDFLSRPRGGVHVSMDLNDFKHINDTLSYQHGDDAIAAAGKALSEASRANRGKLFRTGGDEFRAHFDTPQQAYSFLRRAQQNFSNLQPVGGVHKLSFSAGLGQDQGGADEAAHRAKAAKNAMFGSVRAGGAKVGHGRHFVHSNLPGAVGPVQVEESPEVPPGLKRPTQPMPSPEPFYGK